MKALADFGVLSNNIEKAMHDSDQQRGVDFEIMWSLSAAHISKMNKPIIILDALDECKKPKMLIQSLTDLSRLNDIKIIITSRKKVQLHKLLSKELTIEIRPEYINEDIKTFIGTELSKTPF